MKTGRRRRWTAEKKLQIIEEARQTGLKVSEVCRRYQISPAQFYTWEKQARKAALEALGGNRARHKQKDRQTQLEREVERLRAVIAEITVENPSAELRTSLELKKGRWP
jgi:transposase